MPLSLFSVDRLRGIQPTLRVAGLPSAIPLEKINLQVRQLVLNVDIIQ